MKSRLQLLLKHVGLSCLKTAALIFIMTCGVGCDGPDPQNTISIKTPIAGSTVSAPLEINGGYSEAAASLTAVHVELLRYSDNLTWTGGGWGSSTQLTATLNALGRKWDCASLPDNSNLPDGWYLITARAEYSDGKSVSTNSIFTVGIAPPPVAPSVDGWGFNSFGQLGAGAFLSVNHPVPTFMRGVLDGKIVVAVSAGQYHTLALTSQGAVYAWGADSVGQLGIGADTSNQILPVKVDTTTALGGRKIMSIAAGDNHSLAADAEGRVFAWGVNSDGEIGNGAIGGFVRQAIEVAGFPDGTVISQVAAGENFSVALTADGKVFAWGDNAFGQLGVGSTADSSTPVAVNGLLAGKVVSQISAGGGHVLALTNLGEVFAWGSGTTGELGNNTNVNSSVPVAVGGALIGKKVTTISAGSMHSLAIGEGKVYAWGYNQYGQIGNGAHGDFTPSVLSPVEIAGQLDGKKVTMIETGEHDSFAATEQGQVFVWGRNEWGELAIPASGSGGLDAPTEADFSSVLGNGRILLGLSAGKNHAIAISGFPVLPAPEIEVEAQGVELTDGGSLNFGTVGQGSNNLIFIKVRNGGATGSYLKDLSASVSGDGFSGIFTAPPLATGTDTGFYVTFNPDVAGAATGTVQIFSNDADENPFDITLTGTAYPVGQVDLPFDPQMDGGPDAISVQPDGKVIVGGSFLNVGPVVRNRCARLDATTGAADSFDPNVDNFISCSLVLPDGKVMIGGGFTSVGGVARNKLARLNADGTLDTTYNALIGGSFGVTGMALQRDGKLIIVGNITSVAGVGVTFAARLNPDGTRDSSFAPILNAPPRGVAVRGDGQVLIWGQFTIANGDAYSRIALLNGVDGSTDRSFLNPLIAISGSQIDVAALQPDTKILVGGNVQSVSGTTIHGMCRLNPDGSLDGTFDPNVDGQVNSIALQADGSMIFSGLFTHVSGQPRDRIAKIAANGSLDFYFNPGSGNAMNAVMLQADGNLLCTPGGTIAGESRLGIARLSNGVATQSLTMTNNGATIEWLRDGTAPETNLVTFDVSTDGGTTWSPVGAASRVAFPSRGWVLTDGGLPPTGHIRARAYAQGARYNGSSSIMETIAAYGTPPDITVTEAPYSYSSGNTRLFGVVATGSGSAVMQLTIQNVGGSVITGLSGATIEDNNLSDDKDHRSMFQLTKPSSSSLAPGATANLSVTYLPKTTGRHTAVLRIPSNDPEENPFSVIISGQGSEPFTTYKERLAGDTALPDATITHFKSGQSLLSAYATGTTDNSTDGDGTSITPPTGGGSGFAPASFFGQSPAPSPGGGVFFFNYRRNKLALADVIYQVEWSDTLAPNDWHTDDVTEEITSDDDSIQRVQATVPAGTAGHRFVRLRMTRL